VIFVSRPRHTPTSLSKKGAKAAQERAAVLKFFTAAANVGVRYTGDFQAYKERDVVEALNEIFRQKCAYCESPYKATQPVDVEHYRPKNAVFDEQTKMLKYPGYPWLAFEWSNLLPSCIDCNRQRTQEIRAGSRVLGKANRFPLLSEKQRARRPGDERREVPLLLNPCRDRVETYFFYNDEGFVLPKPKRGLALQRASSTIEICGLYRTNLVRSRVEHLLRIKRDIEVLHGHIKLMNDNPGMRGAMDQLDLIVKTLRAYLEPDQPYTALARQFIEPVIADITK